MLFKKFNIIRKLKLFVSNITSKSPFLLLIIILPNILFHFDFFNFSIRTDSNILYDFSSSWRVHLDMLFNGNNIYEDFYYSYPPVGLYIIKCLFYFISNNIFLQSIITLFITLGTFVVFICFCSKKIKKKNHIFMVCCISLLFFNSTTQEICIGGNPFPLFLGVFFFILGLSLSDKNFVLSLLFLMLSCSCKLEFWPPSLILILSNFNRKNIIYILIVSTTFIILNYNLGYNTFKIITGYGRGEWARWLPDYESIIPQIVLLLIALVVKNIRLLVVLTVLSVITFYLSDFFYATFFSKKMFFLLSLFPFIFIKNKKIFISLLILLSFQLRRGFEFAEPAFLLLVPLVLFYILGTVNLNNFKLHFLKTTILQIFLVAIIGVFTNRIAYPILISKDLQLHRTSVGNITSTNNPETISFFIKTLANKKVISMPHCSGVSYISGAYHCIPVLHFYDRNTIQEYDYYAKVLNLFPDYFVIDSSQFSNYPKLQFPFRGFRLKTNKQNLSEQYHEIFKIIQEKYKRVFLKDNFTVYKKL